MSEFEEIVKDIDSGGCDMNVDDHITMALALYARNGVGIEFQTELACIFIHLLEEKPKKIFQLEALAMIMEIEKIKRGNRG